MCSWRAMPPFFTLITMRARHRLISPITRRTRRFSCPSRAVRGACNCRDQKRRRWTSRADTTFADGTQAHKDRYESERLIPVFQSLGLTAEVVATTEFATCKADSLYIR